MAWFPQLYIILNLLGAIICTVLGITLPQKKDRTALSFQLFIFCGGFWCPDFSAIFLE